MVGNGQHSKNDRQAGFTLIEMMLVVAIIGILAAIAYPNMQKQTAQMRVKDAVNEVEAAFKQARSDALIYQVDVTTTITANTPPTASTLVISRTQGTTPITQTIRFNPQVKISLLHSMPTGIRFTRAKRALENSATASPVSALNASNQTVGYCFSYNNVTVDKYIVTVDALTNVNTKKDTAGECS